MCLKLNSFVLCHKLVFTNPQTQLQLFEKCDMKQMNNIEEIQKLCQTVIDTSNPKWVRRARSGKKDELQKLMQKALELSNYKVNTKSLKQTMKSMLAPKD